MWNSEFSARAPNCQQGQRRVESGQQPCAVRTCRAGDCEWVLSINSQASPQARRSGPQLPSTYRPPERCARRVRAEVRAGLGSTGAAHRNVGDTTSRPLSSETKKGRDPIGAALPGGGAVRRARPGAGTYPGQSRAHTPCEQRCSAVVACHLLARHSGASLGAMPRS